MDRLRDMIPLISRLPSEEKREQKKAIEFFTSTIRKVIKEKRQKMDAGGLSNTVPRLFKMESFDGRFVYQCV